MVPLPVTWLENYGVSHEAWMKAFAESGFQVPGDPVHGQKLGEFANPVTIDPVSHTRAYSVPTYYDDRVSARPNLQILTEPAVEKVILETSEAGKVTAKGVQYIEDGQVRTVGLGQGGQVILAAGVAKSPQVLELSGIGPRDVLECHNIPVVISNPNVGENLQDHPRSSVSFELSDEYKHESGDSMRDQKIVAAAIGQYQSQQSGPLTGAHLAFAYVPLVDSNGRVKSGQIQELAETYLKDNEILDKSKQSQYKILKDILVDENEACGEYMLIPMQLNTNAEGKTQMFDLFTPRTPGNYLSIVAMSNRPFSRGSIQIQSADPHADPRINPGYMSNKLDLELLGRLTQYLENIVKSGPMSKLVKKDGRRIPESGNLENLEDRQGYRHRPMLYCFPPMWNLSNNAGRPRWSCERSTDCSWYCKPKSGRCY